MSSPRSLSRTAVAVLAWVACAPAVGAAQALDDAVADRLRVRLEAVDDPDALRPLGEPVRAVTALPAFYQRRGFRPAWIGAHGPRPEARDLVVRVREAGTEGLVGAHYHLESIERLLRGVRSPSEPPDAGAATDLELLLTDAFLLYGSHLLSGRVNPESIDPEWVANRRGADMAAVLEEALVRGVGPALSALRPPQAGYRRLGEALARYRDIAARGGWPSVAGGTMLQTGDAGPRVAALRQRLRAAGDLGAGGVGVGDGFDGAVAEAVGRFQRRHGLEPTGVVDEATRAAVNVPVEERIEQIALNLERWRWLPQDLGTRHVLVNIAGFELDVIEADTTVMRMRVVVGRTYRRTPVFSGLMTYLVLAPVWHVPRNIAVRDKLPEIARDPGYLDRMGMHVLDGWGADTKEVDGHTIDWSSVGPRNFPYRLRQDPGPLNALGRVKLMFPNRFSVYLHDTPARDLFDRPQRDFSSGCVRVARPMELAAYVLAGQDGWTVERLERAAAQWEERTILLRRPIPVHVLYWTAWADADGTIQFRPDLYGRDERLAPALVSPPPGP